MAELGRKISILGATGSVGKSTVDVILSSPDTFDVQVVTANNNVAALAETAKALHARQAVIANANLHQELKDALSGTNIGVAAGREALLDAASMPADWVMASIVGMAGLLPVMKAVEQGTCVAIANKEPLVAAGTLIVETARKAGTTLLPVDSEHNAIFQVFDGQNQNAIEKIILTASGGPFRTWTLEDMDKATPEQAIAHPNWDMGAKISVDSATMMNKALEVIEARYLFDMPLEKIEVLVHPQSVIHSMVEYVDGSVLAQLGASDMRTPIAHTLAWPGRMKTPGNRLDLKKLSQLDFETLNTQKFPSVALAYESLRMGQSTCVAFNAANEIAVDSFLQKKIGFLDIVKTVQTVLNGSPFESLSGLDDIIEFDKMIREQTKSLIV